MFVRESTIMSTGGAVLAIMAKQPVVGQTKTRLCPPLTLTQAAALYEALLRDTIELVAGLEGVRLAIAITPPEATDCFRRISPAGAMLLPVAGADIGACLNQVLTRLLEGASQQALACNSDGPTLPPAYLRQAVVQLDDNDVVLGPSEDGGYYLIGLKRPCPGLFQGIAWSTGQVLAQTLERAEALGLSVALAPPWYDVDTASDLDCLRGELATLPSKALPYTRYFFANFSRSRNALAGPQSGSVKADYGSLGASDRDLLNLGDP